MKTTTKPYKLYWTAPGTLGASDNVASLKITRKGVIRTIRFLLSGKAGLASNGCQQVELSKQPTGNLTTNDAPSSVLAEATIPYGVMSGAACFSQTIPGLSIPVEVGDTLYAHQVIAGCQGPATSANTIQVFVGEV